MSNSITGAASVKNKLKEFGAQLNSHFADRARSISPMNLPLKKKPVQNDIDRKVQPPEPQKKKPEVGKLRPEPPKLMKEPPKINKEPPKINKEPPKKLVINNDISKRQPIDSETSPNIDETPISVSAFRKNFELNNKNEIPKIHKIPATPKNNTIVNSPWNQSQSPSVAAPEEKKKKIIIKQRSKEIPEEPSKRRSTKDLVEAIERVNSPTTGVKPYRRTQTTQLEENKTNTTNSIATKPLDNKQPQPYRRTRNAVTEPPAPPPPPPPPVLPQEKSSPRTIKLTKQSSTSSPTYTPTQTPTPTSNRSNSRSPQVSHSPSPTPYAKEEPQDSQTGPQKMVFGRVPPKRLSICGRTLSQASQNISDVSNKVTNNDSTTSSISGHSASNSRSESPVLSAVVKPHNRDTDAEKADKTIKNNKMPAQELSDNMVAKRTALSQLNKQLNVENSCSPSASSVDSESSDEELVPTVPIMKSTLTMQLKPNNKNTVKEPEIMPINDIKLTQTKEPSIDNQSVVNRVPLGETKDRQQSFDKNKSKSGLTRSSTAKILNLIKTKSRHDLGLGRVEEDDEIESLLMELEKEGVDNIDWDEIGIDSEEVMDIVNEAKTEDSSDSKESSDEDSSDDEDSDSDDEAVHMVINRQAPQQESEVSDDEFEVVEDEEESD